MEFGSWKLEFARGQCPHWEITYMNEKDVTGINILDLPWREAREAVETGAPVYLLVNPVEYHGPHLSLHNDPLVAAGLARDLHARLSERHPEWKFLATTNIEAGVEPCCGPGSRPVSFQDMRTLVRTACAALAELGAKRVIIMTFHGGPLHNIALHEGAMLLESKGIRAFNSLNLLLKEMLTLDTAEFAEVCDHVPEPDRTEMLKKMKYDFHSGFFETSMALNYAPWSVSEIHKKLPPCPEPVPDRAAAVIAGILRGLGMKEAADELFFASVGMGWYKIRPFTAYTGRPAWATAKAGSIFAKKIVDRYAECAEDLFAGKRKPPEPIMKWLPALSLGGRILSPTVPLEEIATYR